MSEDASSSTGGVASRTSGRNKVKSQRAIESEDTARMFAAVKARQKAEAEAEATAAAAGDVKPSSGSKPKSHALKGKGKAKGKAKKEEVYCVCKKPTDEDDGPMIECAECNDWFHFSCVDLTEDVAERIHNYVCRDCTEATGNKTTMMFDISTFKSPSPSHGRTKPTKRKTSRPKSRQSNGQHESSSSGGDTSDEVDNPPESSTSSSESESEAETSAPKRESKRPRTSKEPSQKPTSSSAPKATLPRPPPPANRKNTALLPKARLFVLDRLAVLVKSIFGDKLDEEGIHRYAKNLEDGLFEGFKDGQGPKAVAGGRYKTQFTLLDRSLPKARPELLDEITSFTLDATKVAHLTSADLASAERLEELEKAKKAALEQTVKQKDDVGTIRMGRDGFERVEDARERELVALARQEQAARKEAERRESLGATAGADDASVADVGTGSPLARARKESASATPQAPRLDRNASSSLPQSPVVKRDSVSVDLPKSPVKSNFGLTSAWASGANGDGGENQPLSLGDQTVLDLSDIVAEPEEEEESVKMDLDEEDTPAKSESVKEEIQPIVWSGRIVNPAVEGSKPVPISVRVAAKNSFEPQWRALLPQDVIAISGRVPIPASLKYLSDSRLNPTKDLITAVFAPSEGVSEEEQRAWAEFVEFHLNKERHAIYHPYGNSPIPYHGARELYLIPMRLADAAPEFTELLDGFSIPTTRDTPILLGVFVGDKKHLHAPPPPPAPPAAAPVPQPATKSPPVSLLPNAKLQELMASLNPAALQGVLAAGGGLSPSTAITPPQPPQDPYPQHRAYQNPYPASNYQQPPPGHGYHSPYPQSDYQGYNQNQPYQQGYGGYPPDAHGGRGGGHTPNWQQGSNYNRDRDNGWSSRGGRRY